MKKAIVYTLYTDDVTEAADFGEELYGMNRLQSKNRNASGNPFCRKKDIDEFVGDTPQFDDIMMLCLEYKIKMEISEDAQ